jgi:hypothetical protein
MLLDADQKVIWPPSPQVSKRGAWGVDGVWIGVQDITVPWTCQADPAHRCGGSEPGLLPVPGSAQQAPDGSEDRRQIIAVAGPIVAAAAKVL